MLSNLLRVRHSSENYKLMALAVYVYSIQSRAVHALESGTHTLVYNARVALRLAVTVSVWYPYLHCICMSILSQVITTNLFISAQIGDVRKFVFKKGFSSYFSSSSSPSSTFSRDSKALLFFVCLLCVIFFLLAIFESGTNPQIERKLKRTVCR